MAKDENDRHMAGELSRNPEDGVEPMPGPPLHPIVQHWKTLGELGDVFGKAPPKRRWLLSNVLPLGKLGVLAAAGGVGKTMAVVQLALSVATGEDWLGTFSISPEGIGRVLLALGEEDAEEVHRRLYNAARAMRLSPDDQKLALERIVVLPLAGTHVALTNAADSDDIETDGARSLIAKMKAHAQDWRLVVFDPLARFAGPDAEKDNAAATRFLETAESFCQSPGNPTVLLIHHSAQHARAENGAAADDASHAARGVTGLTDGSRWVASLRDRKVDLNDAELRRRLGRIAELRIPKNNYAKRTDGVVLLRRSDEHGGALMVLDDVDRKFVDDATKAKTKPKGSSKSPIAKNGQNTDDEDTDDIPA